MRGWPLLALAGALIVLFASLVPASAQARARFFQFNMCGNVEASVGRPCNGGAVQEVAEAIKRSLHDFEPHAVSLNEACETQYRAVLRKLRRAGRWRMHGRFVTTKRGGLNCRPNAKGERRFGNAVLTRNRITWKGVWRLPFPDGTERRKLICVGTRILRRATRACSVHISPEGRRKKRRQIRKVARVVTPWVRSGRPVVLMGDFNVDPDDPPLNRIYSPIHEGASRGVFREVDGHWLNGKRCRCGDATSGSRKIDYIFVSGRHWRGLWGEATHSSVSDHVPLRGEAGRR